MLYHEHFPMSLMVRDWEGGKGEKDKRSWRQEGRIIVPCPPRNWRLLGGLSTGVALSVALPTPSMAAPQLFPFRVWARRSGQSRGCLCGWKGRPGGRQTWAQGLVLLSSTCSLVRAGVLLGIACPPAEEVRVTSWSSCVLACLEVRGSCQVVS